MMEISWNCANDIDPSSNEFEVSVTDMKGSHIRLEEIKSTSEEDEVALISTKISSRLLHYCYKKSQKSLDKSVQAILDVVDNSTQTEDLTNTTVEEGWRKPVLSDSLTESRESCTLIWPSLDKLQSENVKNSRDRSTITTESGFDAGKENYLEVMRSLMETVKDMMHNQADLIKIQTNAINRLATAIQDQTSMMTNKFILLGQDKLE